MTKEEIKQKVLAYGNWEFWFDRPFGAFLLSCFRDGQTRAYMRRFGVDAEWPAIVFQNGAWYKNQKVWDLFEKELQRYLDEGGTVFRVAEQCEAYLPFGRDELKRIERSVSSPREQLAELYGIFSPIVSFVWLVHGFEHLYSNVLHVEIPKYFSGDIEKIIGDVSYPRKKNAHHYFEEALRSEIPLEEVQKKFAWIKARGGFDAGFTLQELEEERSRLRYAPAKPAYRRPEIPEALRELAAIAQELVYFRTLRTDVLYELIWLARPLLAKVAGSFGLTFEELRDYSALDLLDGKVEKYEYHRFSALSFGKDFALYHGAVFNDKKAEESPVLKGAVAFRGVARGIVRIVKVAHEINKVAEGDILVAPTTAPSFIIGMQKAAVFVTDEGGITSHAAIVSREMRKPCVIGTKIATKVLKDGDLVEVDAERGIVKKLS